MPLVSGSFLGAPGKVMYSSVVPSYHYGSLNDPFRDVHPGGVFAPPHHHHGMSPSLVHVKIDVNETPEAYVFRAELPGFSKNDVKVEIEEGRILSISGEKKMEKEEKIDQWLRVERSSGKFLRQFQLPENAKFDRLTAHMENGVLTVTVPKKEVKQHHVRTINITGK